MSDQPQDPAGSDLPEYVAMPDNPFSTSRIRPGAMPYLFPSNESAEQLVRQLREAGRRGQIVGPHGSGKSTLIAELIRYFGQQGDIVKLVTLHDGQRRMPLDFWRWSPDNNSVPQPTAIIDGYEQLGWLARLRLARHCQRRDWGLIVTTHEPVWTPTIFTWLSLPTLYRTQVDVELARSVVDQLLDDRDEQHIISDAELHEHYDRQNGNIREMLFDLYDLYRSRTDRT